VHPGLSSYEFWPPHWQQFQMRDEEELEELEELEALELWYELEGVEVWYELPWP
jgi:hypothetical protein